MGKEILDDQVSVRIEEGAVRRDRLPGQDRILGRAERTRRRVLEGMWAHQDGLLGHAHRDVGRVLEADPHRRGDREPVADVRLVHDRRRHEAATRRFPEAHRVPLDMARRSAELQ